ncbi:MAG: alpha/beta fold hydrolase [Hyphomicrobiales bacterium]|nr:MAG: alpha/beta fold hydrolase [Hyphomicrobiales bacterium]
MGPMRTRAETNERPRYRPPAEQGVWADAVAVQRCVTAAGSAEPEPCVNADDWARLGKAPVIFGACAGWLHSARGRTGVVMCPGFGLHDLAARQSWSLMADRLASAGYPTLRFDYRGAGDAPQDLAAIRSVDAWIADVHEAAEFLKIHAGVDKLVLVGLSIGGLIAAKAAEARRDIADLILLAAPSSGKSFIRELRLSAHVTRKDHCARVAAAAPDGSLVIAGFEIPKAFADSLSGLALAPHATLSAARALLLQPAGADSARLTAWLGQSGCRVDVAEFADFASFMTAPTLSRPFLATVAKAVDWLGPAAPESSPRKAATPLPRSKVRGEGWTETTLTMGRDGTLIGVLCEPTTGARRNACVIMLNSGRDPHVGWGRGNVETARLLATNGLASLRADFAFVGDSQPDATCAPCPLYTAAVTAQVQDFMRALETRGYEAFHLVGSCSGGYAALTAGLADTRVKSIAARNLQRLLYRIDDRVMIPLNERLALSPQPRKGTLLRLARGIGYRLLDTSLVALSRGLTKLLLQRERLQRRVKEFSARGGRVLLVYASAHPALPYLEDMFGADGRDLSAIPNCSIATVEGADHNFGDPAHRQRWNDLLIAHVLQSEGAPRGVQPERSL